MVEFISIFVFFFKPRGCAHSALTAGKGLGAIAGSDVCAFTVQVLSRMCLS